MKVKSRYIIHAGCADLISMNPQLMKEIKPTLEQKEKLLKFNNKINSINRKIDLALKLLSK